MALGRELWFTSFSRYKAFVKREGAPETHSEWILALLETGKAKTEGPHDSYITHSEATSKGAKQRAVKSLHLEKIMPQILPTLPAGGVLR